MSEISHEQVIELLTFFRAESSEQLREAEEALAAAAQAPVYPEILRDITLSEEVPRVLKEAAVTQIRSFFVNNPDAVLDQGLEFFAAISSSVPDDFQIVLEIIAIAIVSVYDEAEQLEILLTAASELIHTENSVASLLIFDAVLSLDKFKWEAYEEEILECLSTITFDTQVCWYYFARAVVSFIKEVVIEEAARIHFLEMAVQVVEAEFENEPYDVKAKWLEVVCSLLGSYGEELDAEPILAACVSYLQGTPSFDGYIATLCVIKEILTEETGSLYASVEDKTTEILMIIAPAFELNDEDIEAFESEPELFIESNFPATFEPYTPKAAAAMCLKQGIEKHPELSFDAMGLLSANQSDNPWEAFQWMNFMSYTSGTDVITEETDGIGELFELVNGYLRSENPVLIAAALQFLSNFPKTCVDAAEAFLPIVLDVLMTDALDVVGYAACCACGCLLQIASLDESTFQDDVSNIITVLLDFSQRYETESMAHAVTGFVKTVGPMFAGFAETYVGHCIEIFDEYMSSEYETSTRSACEFSVAIVKLCEVIETPEVLDTILEAVVAFIEKEYTRNFREDIIPLVQICVEKAEEITPGISTVPKILLDMYEQVGGPPEFVEARSVASILCSLALKFGEETEESIVECIISMTDGLVEDECAWEDDQIAMVTFAEVLFIVLKREDLMEQWMDLFESMSGEFMCDVAAALVQCNPIVALQNPQLCELWLIGSEDIHGNVVPFLASCVAAFSQWDSLPPEVQELGELARATAQQRFETEMQNMSAADIRNVELFDLEAIRTFFKPE